MPWPEFHISKNRYLVTCPYCGRDICYTHPPSGRGRHPATLYHHLERCNPSMSSRERYDVAASVWAKRVEVPA